MVIRLARPIEPLSGQHPRIFKSNSSGSVVLRISPSRALKRLKSWLRLRLSGVTVKHLREWHQPGRRTTLPVIMTRNACHHPQIIT